MSEELRSFLIGTIPLDIVMIVALALTVQRGPVTRDRAARSRAGWIAAIAIAIQGVHFAEEWVTGFNCRFPELVGLAPWSAELWVSFNLVWILVWVLSVLGLRAGVRAALFPIRFLAVASVLNGIAHPLLALAAAGYFPGLWTSPFAGIMGVKLFRTLDELTGSSEPQYRVT